MVEELKNSSYKLVKEIKRGWSSDKKYYIETKDNKKLLMRVSDIKLYKTKKIEFEMMKKVFALDVPMSQPLDFGISKDRKHVYTLLSWIEGRDAETAIPELKPREQYNLGYSAGKILMQIHSISAPDDCEAWDSRFNRKIDNKINIYNTCDIKIHNGDGIIKYIKANKHLIKNRPQSFHHGDYHIGNMILSDNNKLSIIDFNRCDFGDPWEEFNRIAFCASKSPAFASGRIDGYFGGGIPDDFFKLLTLYICINTIASIPWAIEYGAEEVKTMLDMANSIIHWHDNMESFVPSWYKDFR